MRERSVDNFKEFFLLEFTRCLIEESVNITDVVEAEDIRNAKEVKDKVRGRERKIAGMMKELSREKKERSREAVELRKEKVIAGGFGRSEVFRRGVRRLGKAMKKPFPSKMSGNSPRGTSKVSRRPGSKLRIDEPQFADRLRYITPVATHQFVNMGKLNSLISPPLVKQVDCNGANTEIIVRTNRAKKTKITLTEEEISAVIGAFSAVSRIPVSDGVFRAAAGSVELVAMVSSTVGSKFIIRKIRPANRIR
ncbi:hypothetical protein KAR91_82280 [Candidatus Pacearchaeota archaeon]|nr:hypothetical protein [Candidatus Pacearchaeota archaeon]